MRRLVTLALALAALAGCAPGAQPWTIAGTTVAAVGAAWDVGKAELPAAADDAVAALDAVLEDGPELVDQWRDVVDAEARDALSRLGRRGE